MGMNTFHKQLRCQALAGFYPVLPVSDLKQVIFGNLVVNHVSSLFCDHFAQKTIRTILIVASLADMAWPWPMGVDCQVGLSCSGRRR